MREIKFRAWDKVCKYYCNDKAHMSIDLDGNPYNLQNGEGAGTYELEQFTGLHDCEGKEIYEGDVIVIHNLTYEIVFVNGEFCGKALNISNPVSRCDAGNFQSCEIIGNIHETH